MSGLSHLGVHQAILLTLALDGFRPTRQRLVSLRASSSRVAVQTSATWWPSNLTQLPLRRDRPHTQHATYAVEKRVARSKIAAGDSLHCLHSGSERCSLGGLIR